jgi:hypothetical protein
VPPRGIVRTRPDQHHGFVVRGADPALVTMCATPRAEVEPEERVAPDDLQVRTRRGPGERACDENVAAAVEAEVVKVDTHPR